MFPDILLQQLNYGIASESYLQTLAYHWQKDLESIVQSIESTGSSIKLTIIFTLSH
jgi:hypothetical protein